MASLDFELEKRLFIKYYDSNKLAVVSGVLREHFKIIDVTAQTT